MAKASRLAVFYLLLRVVFAATDRNKAFIGYNERQGLSSSPSVPDDNAHASSLEIESAYGKFVVKLLPTFAPRSAALALDLAKRGSCQTCNFYRHEPVPEYWGQNNYYGPPYALLQGSLADMKETPPFENGLQVTVKKGHVCFIPNSKEFFIATADHPEWGTAHTVWGEVEDLLDLPKHPTGPFFTRTDGGGITTRWLNSTFKFQLRTHASVTTRR